MPLLWVAAVFVLALFGGGCSHLQRSPAVDADPVAVRSLDGVRALLQSADSASAHLLLTEIGQVAGPGPETPIWRVAYRRFQEGLKQVLVIAGTHGNETAGVEAVLALVEGLRSTPGPAAGYDMDIIPMVNPWGWVHDRPFNRRGIDVAYDFSRFESHEARIIRRFLREKRYDLVLDLREDQAAAGFYLWQYATSGLEASTRIIDRLRTAGYPIENDPDPMLLKPRNGIIDMPSWGLKFVRLTRQRSIAEYLRQFVSSGVFTVVTPAALPMADRIAMQRMAVEGLLAELAEPNNRPEPFSN